MSASLTLLQRARDAYRFRWMRRRRLYDALRRRHELTLVRNRTNQIKPNDVLLFSTMRNEMARLPHFMSHYRTLGISHFLIVDNESDDGTRAFLEEQDDVSLWWTEASYRRSHFGTDWLAWLRVRFAKDHWCLTVDADEILIYPHCTERKLDQLVTHLDYTQVPAMGALMVDMYPKGPLGEQEYEPGNDPFQLLRWFDGQAHVVQRQAPMDNLWVRGGVRARAFFSDDMDRAPTMNKLPLVKWNRRYAYVNSTHSMLPRSLNHTYEGPGDGPISGVLLHTKFLPSIARKSHEEKKRGEHFGNPGDFDQYYDRLTMGENLWQEASLEYSGWPQMAALGLMSDRW